MNLEFYLLRFFEFRDMIFLKSCYDRSLLLNHLILSFAVYSVLGWCLLFLPNFLSQRSNQLLSLWWQHVAKIIYKSDIYYLNYSIFQNDRVDNPCSISNFSMSPNSNIRTNFSPWMYYSRRMYTDQTFNLVFTHRLRLCQNSLISLIIILKIDLLSIQELLCLLNLLPKLGLAIQNINCCNIILA